MGEPLGRGGAGVVYAATREASSQRGALKLAHADAGGVRNHWFGREANLAARLRHPNIVALLEWGYVEDRPYLVYERVDGPALEEVADQLTLGDIVRIGAEVLAALGYAHDAGVVHCDITPANVLMDRDGTAKLTDFGLAKARDESRTRHLSGDRLVSGTPGYLSPEQARGVGSPGPASDLFGCGALLYRLLTGEAPYVGDTAIEIVESTLSSPPRPLRPRKDLRAPAGLAQVVHTLLARDPGQRYPCAARACQAWLGAAARHTPFEGMLRPKTSQTLGLQSMETILAGGIETGTLAEGGAFSTLRATPARVSPRAPAELVGPRVSRPAMTDEVMAALGTDLDRMVSLAGSAEQKIDDVVHEVREAIVERGVRVCFARGRQGGRCAPFETLASLVLDALGAAEITNLRRGVDVLAAAAKDADVEDAQWGKDALIGGLLGVGPTGSMGTAVMEAFALTEALLEPDRRPVVLVVGDADGMDEGTRDVIRALTQREGGGVGALFVRDRSAAGDDEVRVDLPPADDETLERCWARWSGRTDAPRPETASPADLLALATLYAQGIGTFDDLLVAIDPATLALLRACVVFDGDVPKRGALEVAAGFAQTDVEEASIAWLMASQVLTDVDASSARREPWVRLLPPALSATVDAGMSDALKKDYLVAAAQWLSRSCLDDSAAIQARVADLAERAGVVSSAAHALYEAARIELESGRLRGATPFLEKAIALARGDAQDAIDHARAEAWLAEAAVDAGLPVEAETHAKRALDVVEPGRPVLVAKLLAARADAAIHAGDLDTSVTLLHDALGVLGEDGDPMELARVHSLLGWVLGYRLGRNEEGIEHGQRALEVASRISAPAFRASLCGKLGANYLRAGDWDGQLETNQKDLELSTRARDTAGIVRANINLGVCFHNRGYLDLARDHTARARDLAARSGAAGALQIGDNNLAMIALDDGREADVERHATAVVEGAERTGYRRALPETLITLCRLKTRRGDYDGAVAHLEEVADTSDVADFEMALRAWALLELARGDLDAAEERIAQVFEQKEHDPYERAQSRVTRAAIHRARGDEEAAGALEAEADAVFESLGADPALERKRWGRTASRG